MPPVLRVILFTLTLFVCGLVGHAAEPESEVKFYGVADSAKKVVYILESSGSMLDTRDFLREEVTRSVNALMPEQSFRVVMFAERGTAIYPQLQQATPETKKDFASKPPNFQSASTIADLLEPYPESFEKAFAMQPEVIYFLKSGRFDPRAIGIVSKQLNKAKKIRVHTLMFVNTDPLCEEQLKEIAKQNGGAYKFVAEIDLADSKQTK